MKLKYFIAPLISCVIFVACVTQRHTVDPVTGTTNTLYVPDPRFVQAVETLKTATPAIPAPFGELAAGVLALITTGVGVYANMKNKQHKDAVVQIARLTNGAATAATQKPNA